MRAQQRLDDKLKANTSLLTKLQKTAKLQGGKCLTEKNHGYRAKYIFECRNKHTFTARAEHVLSSGSWCPYCAHGRVTDQNNLAVKNPSLAAEWHTKKNKLSPNQVTSTSQYRVWWKCRYGHEWRQAIRSRTNLSQRSTYGDCPTCGSLGVHAPHLVAEWHKELNGHISPFIVRPFSNKKVWWQCLKGHIWQALVGNRFGGSQCPRCSSANASSRREFRLFAELEHIFANVLHRKKVDGVEVDILLPRQRVAIEYDGKRWHQDKVNEDNKKTRFLADRGYRLLRVRERGLPRVRGQFVTVDPKDLRKHDIDAVLRLIIGNIPAPKEISDYLKSTSFQNEDGYLRLMESFPTTPNKNLQSTHPEITKQWSARNDPLLPSAFSYGSNYSAWWQCEVDQQHVWQMPIKSRTGQDQGCPYCSGNRISNSNSLAAKRKDLLSFWNHELNTVFPDQVSIGSRRMVWWKCRRNGGHSYKMTVKHKVGGQGCAVCSGKQFIPESSFGALYPEQANYWDKTRNGDLGPLQVAPFSSKRVFWSCKNGHSWELQVSKMTKRKRGCIHCQRAFVTQISN